MTNHVIDLADIPSVYYSCDHPSQTEIAAVDRLLELNKNRQVCIMVFGDRIAVIFSSGNFVEYSFDQQTGEMEIADHKDNFIQDFVRAYMEA